MWKLRSCSTNTWLHFTNYHLLSSFVNLEISAKLKSYNTSHNLRQRSNFLTIFTIKGNDNLRILLIFLNLIDNIRLRCQFRRRHKMLRIILIDLTTNTQFYFIRELYLLSIEIKTSKIIPIHLIWQRKFLIFHPIMIACVYNEFPLGI